jgi:hypothetical protein
MFPRTEVSVPGRPWLNIPNLSNRLKLEWQSASHYQRLKLYNATFKENYSGIRGRDLRRIYLKYVAVAPWIPGSGARSLFLSFFYELHDIESNCCQECLSYMQEQCILSSAQKDAYLLLEPLHRAKLVMELEGHRQRLRLVSLSEDCGEAQGRMFLNLFDSWRRRDLMQNMKEKDKADLLTVIEYLQEGRTWAKDGWILATATFLNNSTESPICSCCKEVYKELQSTVIKMDCGTHTCCDTCYTRSASLKCKTC